jgi:Ser/Thr protein kinase RdoA (MazF antagonist)
MSNMPETSATQMDEALDPHAILQALGVTDAISVARAEGGTDTAIWRVQRPNGAYALRVFRTGDDDASAIEQAAMRAASAAGLPVPAVHASGDWQGRPVLLLTWLPGRSLAEESRRRPWRAWALAVAYGRTQAMIHALAAPKPLAERPDDWLAWAGSDYPKLVERLRHESQPSALLHLDYHPLNVLTNGQRITGVLDWRNALAGPPRADAARTSAILRVDYIGRLSLAERAVRGIFERGWRAGYEEIAGPLGDMSLYNAWAGAVMLRDLAAKRDARDLARIRRWTETQLARAIRTQSAGA